MKKGNTLQFLSNLKRAFAGRKRVQKMSAAAVVTGLVFTGLSTPAAFAGVSPASCNSGSAPTVEFLSDPGYQINTATNFDSNYIGYKVTANSDIADMWVSLSNFAGGVISLAPGQASAQSSGAVASGSSASTFFLGKASGETTTAQTHTVTVYDGNPANGGTALCETTGTFNRVDDTITANANKVDTITVSSSSSVVPIGAEVNVTVVGSTGTIGNGPNWDPGVINLAPSVESSFPVNAWRLVGIDYITNPGTGSQLQHLDQLHFQNAQGEAGPYTVTYKFRAIGETTVSATLTPIQYIASGTQVKKTGSMPSVLPLMPTVGNTLTLAKSANVTSLPAEGGDVTYTLTVTNTADIATTVDDLVDTIPSGASYVTGSTKIGGNTVSDPSSSTSGSDTVLTFTGPFTVPASGTFSISYTLTLAASEGVVAHNTAIGHSGGSQIDATLSTSSSDPASADVTVGTPAVGPTATGDSGSTISGGSTTLTPGATEGSSAISSKGLVDGSGNLVQSLVVPGEGTWTVNNDGTVTFAADANFVGTATSTFKVVDANGLTSTASLSVTVTTPPVGPTATGDTGSTTSGNSATLNPTGVAGSSAITSKGFVDGSGNLVQSLTVTGEGTWTMNNDGSVTFTADANFVGTATATFKVVDGNDLSATATLSVTVSEPVVNPVGPSVSGDSDSTTSGGTVNLTPTVTPGDAPVASKGLVDGDGNLVQSLVVPGEGTWTVNNDGSVSFTADSNFVGTATATFKVVDENGLTSTTPLSVTVTAPPAEPTGPSVLGGSGSGTGPVTITPTVTPGSSPIASKGLVDPNGNLVQTLTVPNEGTWTVNPDGSVTFTPVPGFLGTANATFKVIDENGLSATTPLSVTIVAPPANGTINGSVWFDVNGNGNQGLNEPSLAGIIITARDGNGHTVTATTDALGNYSLSVPAGSWTVVATLPGDYAIGGDSDGGKDWSQTVTVTSGNTSNGSFWAVGVMAVDGTVVLDNGDVVPNAEVTLTWAGPDGVFGNGDDVLYTTAADAKGYFSFASLPGGVYKYTAKNPSTGELEAAKSLTLTPAAGSTVTVQVVLPTKADLAYTGDSGFFSRLAAGLALLAGGALLVARRRKDALM